MLMTRSRSKLPTILAVAGTLLIAGIALVIYGIVSRRPQSFTAPAPLARATAAATAAPTSAAAAVPTVAATAVPTTAATAAASAAATAAATPAARTPVAMSADDFRYRGKWQVVSGMNDGRYDGMSARSLLPGARVIIRFVGHGIRLYGVDGPGGGTGTVAIDGAVLDPDVGFKAPVKRTHTLVFASGTLPQGRHQLTVTVNGPGPHARHGYVNVESAAYDP